MMEKVIIFCLLSIPVLLISRRSLLKPGSHGFYRFFGWESILWLVISNIRYWYVHPFCLSQILSWIFLFYASYIVIAGVVLLKRKGVAQNDRQDPTLFTFEKTTQLVETGIFKYIRHPLYGSLIFLAWGIFLKNITFHLFIVTLFSSVMFLLTAKMDEKECMVFFGESYREYMKKTKMFVPFLF